MMGSSFKLTSLSGLQQTNAPANFPRADRVPLGGVTENMDSVVLSFGLGGRTKNLKNKSKKQQMKSCS